MRFDVLTLFPEMLSAFLDASILKRAQEKEILSIQTLNIRDYAENKHNRVDDAPFGGGMGMLMQAGPIVRAFESIAAVSYTHLDVYKRQHLRYKARVQPK